MENKLPKMVMDILASANAGEIFPTYVGEAGLDYVVSIASWDFDVICNDNVCGEAYVKSFSNEYLQCAYIISKNICCLVFKPLHAEIIFVEDVFNQSIDAGLNYFIREFAVKNEIAELQMYGERGFSAISMSASLVLAHLNSMSESDLDRLKKKNTFSYLVKNYLSIKNELPVDAKNHIEYFAWIYYLELKVISDIFSNADSVHIHDVATNTAGLPLLISYLERDDLFGIEYSKIECSDIDVSAAEYTMAALDDLGRKAFNNISIKELDLLGNTSLLNKADVIIANDILEHFDEDVSFQVFKKLCSNTNNILIIHVPFEDTACVEYGHRTTFNKEKLYFWADQVEGIKNITSNFKKYSEKSFDPVFIDNFLILKKESK